MATKSGVLLYVKKKNGRITLYICFFSKVILLSVKIDKYQTFVPGKQT